MLATSHSPPSRDLFQWTDGLRSLLHPNNVDLHLGAGGANSTPIPTNEWWGNWLAWDHQQQRDSDPIFANPYVYHIAQKRGLSVGYLHDYRQDGPINENGAIKYYFYPATVKNVVFSAAEWTSTPSFSLQIESWDDLGLTFQLSGSNTQSPMTSAAQGLRGYLSMGNAFTSLEYHGQMHPQIQTDHAILQVNDQVYQDGIVVEGNVFQVLLNNGHRWVFYFFPSANTGVMQSKTRVVMHQNVLTTVDVFDGVVQAAYVSSQQSRQHEPDSEPKALALYQAVAGVFPVGANVVTETDGVSFGYEWKLKNVRDTGAQPTCPSDTHLHFALPHLQVMMDHTYVIRKTELTLWSHTRGPMAAYILRTGAPAKKWRFTVPSETSVGVDQQATEFLPVNTSVPGHVVDQLKLVDVVTNEILHTDWNKDLPQEGSYYFKGKALQKFATMVLVAKRLAMTTSPQLQSVFEKGLDKLRTHLKEFAKNKAAYPLVYDTVYKGIITSEGIKKRDYNVDFGNAAYNDHHYHYGYLITATAILLHLDAGPARHHQEDYAELRVFIETLIRDVVNPDASDAYFPRFRLFNWFLGHSYSHGVTPMADGKDEESTSEEVNFLYGLALYSRVTQHAQMETLAKLMLKVNAIAIETYFLISDDRIGLIHPASFGKNKVTGICFDNKCDYATWFNPARECIHGIQMIPVSPMLDVVRTRQFIKEEWEQILSKLDCVTKWDTHGSGWTSLLYSNAAVLDAELACHVLSSCPVDDGLSRAWALYMAATKLRQ